MDTEGLIAAAQKGFLTLNVGEKYKTEALQNLRRWLTEPQFADYHPQIKHLIQKGDWDYLLDCFYQTIPFGTGGRRGEVGIGPNRINRWTIQASAQGHSQYLVKRHGPELAQKQGVLLAYDVREFFTNAHFDESQPNPVRNLNCKDLAVAAAEVYAANKIQVYIFDGVRTTPELSFGIRYLKCLSGDMFSASHNPPEHNGKKVYDETGGQLVPPEDQVLSDEVTQNVTEIKSVSFAEATQVGLIKTVGKEIDDVYINQAANLSLSSARDIKIVYTPFHGTGGTSVVKVLRKLGFTVNEDPKTSNQSGKFENITFNIPNPEVEESFNIPLQYAQEIDADILLSSDPDADRIGVMIKDHDGKWVYVNGNEVAVILTAYVVQKRQSETRQEQMIIKTDVTNNLMAKIAEKHHIGMIGDLPVGFKYIGVAMNQLEKQGKIAGLLIGAEESHGYITGNYLRDKDSCIGAIWLSEKAAELKANHQNLLDYLNDVYREYGYFKNYLTEIRLPGAEGMEQISTIQTALRDQPPKFFGQFEVEKITDFWDRQPILSETDRVSKNVLVYEFKKTPGVVSLRVTIRPSGTEPKIKMYFEIGFEPGKDLNEVKRAAEDLLRKLEIDFMTVCYQAIGVDLPKRGFLLFWQLPLSDKLKYFEIENQIADLKKINNQQERQTKLNDITAFLGSDPTQKVNRAFQEKFGSTIEKYLALE